MVTAASTSRRFRSPPKRAYSGAGGCRVVRRLAVHAAEASSSRLTSSPWASAARVLPSWTTSPVSYFEICGVGADAVGEAALRLSALLADRS